MSESGNYLHGYSRTEQERLVAQAAYWRTPYIRPGLGYAPGERVLEIGCGAGAVLEVLATEFRGIEIAGIDRSEQQIAFAREHLRARAIAADLRVGDAGATPWEDASFDHVFAMWVLEHIQDSAPLLAEALRVLKPGGSIALNETDYSTFRIDPESPDFDLLARAQYDYFRQYGRPYAGRQLGALLVQAGFEHVRSAPVGFHFFDGDELERRRLRAHVAYTISFLEPAIEPMVAALGVDATRLRRGIDHLRALPDRPGASMTQIAYRALGRRPAASSRPAADQLVSLRPLGFENLDAVQALAVAPDQTVFVADNPRSIAQASCAPHWMRAVYLGEQPAGFVLLHDESTHGRMALWRFMVDERFQSQGVGRRAIELVIEHVRTLAGVTELVTSAIEGPGGPRPFYEKLGFELTGEVRAGETVLRLVL